MRFVFTIAFLPVKTNPFFSKSLKFVFALFNLLFIFFLHCFI
ncbi:hypothetical protein N878_26795 [Pseudomonas sp. EGD-AK9]|nr:hypothetical protein N878_26795 [Pseudomonas sp. EGD-AK9]